MQNLWCRGQDLLTTDADMFMRFSVYALPRYILNFTATSILLTKGFTVSLNVYCSTNTNKVWAKLHNVGTLRKEPRTREFFSYP